MSIVQYCFSVILFVIAFHMLFVQAFLLQLGIMRLFLVGLVFFVMYVPVVQPVVLGALMVALLPAWIGRLVFILTRLLLIHSVTVGCVLYFDEIWQECRYVPQKHIAKVTLSYLLSSSRYKFLKFQKFGKFSVLTQRYKNKSCHISSDCNAMVIFAFWVDSILQQAALEAFFITFGQQTFWLWTAVQKFI